MIKGGIPVGVHKLEDLKDRKISLTIAAPFLKFRYGGTVGMGDARAPY